MNDGRRRILDIRELRAGYGFRDALHSVTLAVEEGSVCALLGRNGAGKSTLVRCLLGQMKARGGKALLFGQDGWRWRAELMDRVGVVPEDPDLQPTMRVSQIAAFCERLHATWDGQGFRERLDRFRIDGSAQAGSLSRGQKTRLALALALASRPELLVLDDPTLGLDAVARRSFYEELGAVLAERPATVLMATHDLSGVEGFADRIVILREGRLVLEENLEELKARFRRLRWPHQVPEADLEGLEPLRVERRPWGTEALVARFDEGKLPAVDGLEVEPLPLEDLFIALADDRKEVLK